MKVAVTGANGHLGQRLVEDLGASAVALVRSESAKQTLIDRFPDLLVRVVDYQSVDSLKGALDGCDKVVHLVGIIKENRFSRYEDSHEKSCEALIEALPASVTQVIYLSIVGSHATAKNPCLASKGKAEEILMRSGKVSVAVLQVPMVLGEGDYASSALARNAAKSIAFTFRAGSLEQPIYAGDVIHGIKATFSLNGGHRFVLGGPESLPRKELIKRAAKVLGKGVQVISLPIALGYGLAWIFERLMAFPPVTVAMLGVLDHDDKPSEDQPTNELELELTPLDELLKKTIQA